MKPLLAKDLAAFMERFNNFKDGEFRSLKVLSPTTMKVTLAGQDEARAFDWISLELEFNSVNDAKLIDNSKLHLLDMCSGISIIYENGVFAFCHSECYNMSHVKDSISYILCSDLKYQEGLF